MNTIRNYLDNMFRNLPNTEEVRKAKAELLSMMEDKFEELTNEGKTENEAVGIVISEFGNLDEVAQSIGLSMEIKNNAAPAKPMLTLDRVKEYLSTVGTRSLLIPLAIALCILSVTCPMMTELIGISDALGAFGFFVFIAAAVVLFVISASKNGEFKEIKNDQVSLGIEISDYVRNERTRFKPTYSMQVAIGIALCILSVSWPIVVDAIGLEDLGGLVFFLSVAIGVFLIVSANVRMNGYDRLLELNGAGSMSEEFVPKADRKVSKAPIVISIIIAVLVLGVAAVIGIVKVSKIFFGDNDKYTYVYDIDYDDSGVIDTISIDAEACSVVISTGSVDSIEANYEGKEELMPEITYDEGQLLISQHVNRNQDIGVFNNGPEVVITIPEGTEIGDINVNMDAGNLELNYLTFTGMTGELDAGNIEIRNCTADTVRIATDAGNYELENSAINTLALEAAAGNIELSNIDFEIANVESDFGNIEISGIDDIGYYTIDIESDLANVEVDGVDEGTSYHSEGTGSGVITATCDTGNIEIG